jgi:hypothetical protein
LDITNNAWYSTGTNWYEWNTTPGNNLTTWNALTGVGTDLNSDPLYTDKASNDFTLQYNSPCVDTGTDVGLTQDYLGNTVPIRLRVDMGAYELQGYSSLTREPTRGRGNYLNDYFDQAGQRINQARPTPGEFEMPFQIYEEEK